MFWEKKFKDGGFLWGEGPSELGKITVNYIKAQRLDQKELNILDIGCGYGRDAFFLSKNINCKVTGVDSSKEAIKLANDTLLNDNQDKIEFKCSNFKDLEEKCDIVLSANFYQILKKKERNEFIEKMNTILKPGGLLFLSTLSVNDPEHSGKGTPVSGEPNSYKMGTYVHLCDENELKRDFSFLNIQELYELEFLEPRASGKTHHHKSWILIGKKRF